MAEPSFGLALKFGLRTCIALGLKARPVLFNAMFLWLITNCVSVWVAMVLHGVQKVADPPSIYTTLLSSVVSCAPTLSMPWLASVKEKHMSLQPLQPLKVNAQTPKRVPPSS